MNRELTEEQAIRLILSEGTGGDFVDVAELVKKRFGLLVGSSMVEKVYHEMLQAPTEHEKPILKLKHADISLTGGLHAGGSHSPESSAARGATPDRLPADASGAERETLKFVQAMGGFEQARKAINDLENSVRKLL